MILCLKVGVVFYCWGFCLVVPSVAVGAGYVHLTCACVDSNSAPIVSVPVTAVINIQGGDGLNKYFINTDGPDVVQTIYGAITKTIEVSGTSDIAGNLSVDCSTDGPSLAASCVSCSGVAAPGSGVVSMALGGITALAFALAFLGGRL